MSEGVDGESNKRPLEDPVVAEEDDTDDICCMCHDGGELLPCDGPCKRSFHPTVESADEDCRTLEMTEQEVRRYTINEDLKFFCKNCKYGQQQCFVCKELGSSTGKHENMKQVFPCPSCARFFHANCGGIPEPGETTSWECPSHRCHADQCSGGGKLIPCRLCPKAWHESCLSKDISFQESSDGVFQRGWRLCDEETDVEKSVFVFCTNHELNRRGMPAYNSSLSILFPEDLESPRPRQPDSIPSSIPSQVSEPRRKPRRTGEQPQARKAVQVAVPSPGDKIKNRPRQEVPKRIPPPVKSIKQDFAVKPKRPAILLDPEGPPR